MRLRAPLVMATTCLAVVALTLSAGSSWAIDANAVHRDMEKTYKVSGTSFVDGANNTAVGLWKDPRVTSPTLPSAKADLEFQEDIEGYSRRSGNVAPRNALRLLHA